MVGTGVVIGAVLILEFGGGVVTLAPIADSVAAGILPDMDETALQLFVTASMA